MSLMRCGWLIRFIRFFFPLEADRQREFHGHLDTQRMSSPLQNSVAARKDTVKLPMYGHYDVCTTWDTVCAVPIQLAGTLFYAVPTCSVHAAALKLDCSLWLSFCSLHSVVEEANRIVLSARR